jgi:hypothetical protein
MATLNISDLSVGDWVMVEWPDGERWRGRLTRLSETGAVEVRCTNDKYVRCSSNFITSIPITAEILEKNGFVKSDDFLHKIDLPDNILLGVRRQTDGYIFELKREKRRIGELLVIIRGIKYIHDLQHALRLAGVDKEINL